MPDFRLSNSAVQDLMAIAVYGDEHYGMDASDVYRIRLEKRFSKIANNRFYTLPLSISEQVTAGA
ncbi:MAG: hypothetical protein COB08_015040 [Rhodobacteraceae bacterium]|nr:hypothetical protein [Paracoccaceae bacterium]